MIDMIVDDIVNVNEYVDIIDEMVNENEFDVEREEDNDDDIVIMIVQMR